MTSSRYEAPQPLPIYLEVESTAICNLKCVMCPQGLEAVDRPKHMPEALFDKLGIPLAQARSVQLHGIGEPLASPAFWRALESDAFAADTDLIINTNITLLDEKRLKVLTGARGRLLLNISLDAATARTYERIRGYDFDKVKNNIRRLRAARGDRYYPLFHLNMTLMRENIEEVVSFVELAKELGADGICLWHMNQMPDHVMARFGVDRDDWHFEYAEQGLWNDKALSNQMIRAAQQRAQELGIPLLFDPSRTVFFDEDEEHQTQDPSSLSMERAPDQGRPGTVKDCNHPWQHFQVGSDGMARACCYSKPIGDLNQTSFAELWNGPVMRDLRKAVVEDRRHDICEGAACKYVRNMPPVAPVEPSFVDQPLPPVEKAATGGLRKLFSRLVSRLGW